MWNISDWIYIRMLGSILFAIYFLPRFPDFDKSIPFLIIHFEFWYEFSLESP